MKKGKLKRAYRNAQIGTSMVAGVALGAAANMATRDPFAVQAVTQVGFWYATKASIKKQLERAPG